MAQAAGSSGFAWSSRWAALNLFSWLVVSTYLIWGCRPRYRVLGLLVVPPAGILLGVAYVGGGAGVPGDPLGALLAVHVALVLAALAGFTLAAALAAFYLWHERRLKRHERMILRLPVPPLDALELLERRLVAASLAALTGGIALGFASLARGGGSVDPTVLATLAVAATYGLLLAAERAGRLQGRRTARATLGAFSLVLVTLAVAHFG